jgi:hypothetical protein
MDYVAIAERVFGERRVIAQYPSMVNQAHAIVRNALRTTIYTVNSLRLRMHARKLRTSSALVMWGKDVMTGTEASHTVTTATFSFKSFTVAYGARTGAKALAVGQM